MAAACASINQSINGGAAAVDNAVSVSFDDGWKNNLIYAAPILAKYNIPATVFLTTDYIGTTGQLFQVLEYQELSNTALEQRSQFKHSSPDARLEMLDKLRKTTAAIDFSESWKQELYEFLLWDDVRTLKELGWTIGCHTKTHQILSLLSAEEQRQELHGAKEKIEQELGEPCLTLAYPNGGADDYNDDTVRIAEELGFTTAFTLENKRNELPLAEPFRIHRICITRDLTLNSFRAILSGIRGK